MRSGNKSERITMNNQFDELTKSMAQSVTRRAALKKFGVGLAGAALACFLTISRSPAGADDGPSTNAAAIRVTTETHLPWFLPPTRMSLATPLMEWRRSL